MTKCFVCKRQLEPAASGLNTIKDGHYMHRACIKQYKNIDVPIPRNLAKIRTALMNADRQMRSASICKICGRPKSGIIQRVSAYTVGTTSGASYVPGDTLTKQDAGLCICEDNK